MVQISRKIPSLNVYWSIMHKLWGRRDKGILGLPSVLQILGRENRKEMVEGNSGINNKPGKWSRLPINTTARRERGWFRLLVYLKLIQETNGLQLRPAEQFWWKNRGTAFREQTDSTRRLCPTTTQRSLRMTFHILSLQSGFTEYYVSLLFGGGKWLEL